MQYQGVGKRSRTLNISYDAPGVASMRILFVNLAFLGHKDGPWVLVDTGLSGHSTQILKAVSELFGPGSRPEAILMTHGHFDHTGCLEELATHWDVPVYAHPLEIPYLTGQSKYPPPDPTVGGGAMAVLSFAYPRGPVDLGDRVRPLPEDGTVPGAEGWRWIHTPGHAPGHVSLWRQEDRVLLSGDAVVNTCQESALSVMMQDPELNGPPMYFTVDWIAARESVRTLAALNPEIIVSGHGSTLYGPEVRADLHDLAENFAERAMPSVGRYVREPARMDEAGVQYVPPIPPESWRRIALVSAFMIGTVVAVWAMAKGGDDEDEG